MYLVFDVVTFIYTASVPGVNKNLKPRKNVLYVVVNEVLPPAIDWRGAERRQPTDGKFTTKYLLETYLPVRQQEFIYTNKHEMDQKQQNTKILMD